FAGAASADVVVGAAPLTATNATSLSFAEGGVGHALLVPYFNAQNGNMTVLHVVNTDTSRGKAVKVRFRGALNSDDILDFQVFMSPGDVWAAAVTTASDGVAQLTTTDGTCTLPTLGKNTPQRFVTDRLNPGIAAVDKANNTREGYVEIFNMADIPPTKVGTTATTNPLFTAIKHVNGVAPCTQATLDATLQNFTTPQQVADAGFDTPSTGLVGDWYIINVAQTTTFSGGATAIRAEANGGAPGIGNFVHFPQNEQSAPTPDSYTADPLFRSTNVYNAANVAVTTPKIVALNYDLPDMSTPYTVGANGAAVSPLTQATNLTDALAVTSITNQYATDESITAKTDWVFSMPTRRYNVAANYAAANQSPADTSNVRLFTNLTPAVGGAPEGVTDERFNPSNTSLLATGGAICVNSTGQAFYDREENTKTAGAVFSPGSQTQTRFCGETSVLSFASGSVLSASVAAQQLTNGAYVNGWSRVSVPNNNRGLPILGSSFIKLSNPQATAGTSGTYGITWPHRFTRPAAPQ
ncbi:cell surface protein, partial [Paracidovorax citrulli]